MAQAAASALLTDDDVAEIDARLLAIRAELKALNEQAKELRQARATLVRKLVDHRGWKHVARLLGVGMSRVYAMRTQESPPDAERRGAEPPPPATSRGM